MKSTFPLLLVILASTAFAADLYVATTGSDSNNGSPSTPWKTIQHATNVVNAGDTVHVASGTYTTAAISSTHSGTSGSRIVFVSDSKWGAQIVINSGSNLGCWVNSGDYVDINGFDITEDSGGAGSCTHGIYSTGANVDILHNRVHDLTHNTYMTTCNSNG